MPGPFRVAPPVLPAGAQTRPRLLRQLVGRFSHRCTIVVAGAGHGKTTLLTQAFAENRLAPRGDDIWLTLEAADADCSHLARGLLRALDVESNSVELTTITDAVWREAPTEVCFLLDDVHELPEDSTGAQLLTSLMLNLPANGHLVVASRTPPPLPFARLAASGALIQLDEEGLRFDEEEVLTFAAERGVDAGQLSAAAGWPAMAELLAAARSDLAGDFLWQEVLKPLGTGQRRVLAVLAELDGGDDRLLSAALGEPVELTAHVPLVAVGADGWREPHALWRSAVGLSLPDAERIEVRRRAALDLISRDRPEAAFDLLADAGLWNEVPDLLQAACRAGTQPKVGQLRVWLERCPAAVRLTPGAALATGVLASLTTPELAGGPLRTAIAHLREVGDVDGELSAMSHLAHVAWWQGDLAVLGELSPRVAELDAEGSAVAGGLAAIGRALVCSIQANDAGVLACLESVTPGLLDPHWDAVVHWLRGWARAGLGDPDGFVTSLESALTVADPVFSVVIRAALTAFAWNRGHVDSVVADAADLMAALEPTGIDQHIAPFAATCARACAYLGALEAARTYLARARAASAHVAPAALVQIALADAAVAVAERDEERAAATLRSALLEHPMDRRRGKATWRMGLGLLYVLLPELRDEWDELDAPAGLVTSRDLAAAIVAGREDDRADPLATLDVSHPGRVRAALPFSFVAELAVRLHETGRPTESTALLEPLGEPGRAHVRSLGTPGARSLLAAVPAAPAMRLSVCALGCLEVDGVRIDRARVRELLGYLLLHRAATRSALTAVLWPDLADRAAANNLRVTLSHLLRLLEPDRSEGEATYSLRVTASELRLVTGALDVDLDDFDSHLEAAAKAEADGTPSHALDRYAAAADLYRGELLEDLPGAPWADVERDSCRSRFVSAAVRAGELLTSSGQLDRAEQIARRALDVDEWCEPAFGVLTSTALARGDRSGGLRVFERCQEMLRDLGVEPSAATRQLARRVRAA